MRRSNWFYTACVVAAAALTFPAFGVRFTHAEPGSILAAVLFGGAIVGAAFLLSWAAEAAELDISKGLAVAILALIAVLPEYAVDFVFTSKAGKKPGEYGPLALANMTGANRLLIGLGWSLVVLLAVWGGKRVLKKVREGRLDPDLPASRGLVAKSREVVRTREVRLSSSNAIAVAVLGLACTWSFVIPLMDSLSLVSTAVLVPLYFLYLWRTSRLDAEAHELVGPAALFGPPLRPIWRRTAVGALFLFAGTVIFLFAGRFADALVNTGKEFGISEFLLVQWLAPLASEAPELIVAVLYTLRGDEDAGLGTLVSSKVNQWTLLVGTLPIVYAVSSGGMHGLALEGRQVEEMFLTAAQSLFGFAVLASLSISMGEATLLFGLFAAQLALPYTSVRWGFGIAYVLLALYVIVRQRRTLWRTLQVGVGRLPLSEAPTAG